MIKIIDCGKEYQDELPVIVWHVGQRRDATNMGVSQIWTLDNCTFATTAVSRFDYRCSMHSTLTAAYTQFAQDIPPQALSGLILSLAGDLVSSPGPQKKCSGWQLQVGQRGIAQLIGRTDDA